MEVSCPEIDSNPHVLDSKWMSQMLQLTSSQILRQFGGTHAPFWIWKGVEGHVAVTAFLCRSELKAEGGNGAARAVSENAWLYFGDVTGLPVHIFRLAGVYGPGRNAIEAAKRVRSCALLHNSPMWGCIRMKRGKVKCSPMMLGALSVSMRPRLPLPAAKVP